MATEPITAANAARNRAQHTHAALQRLTERHAATAQQRHRHTNPYAPDPYEAIAVVLALAAGAAQPVPGEEPVDEADLLAALTLFPHLRAEIDTMEVGLLNLARSRGLTWQAIGQGLGLGSAQAAKQRYERLAARTSPAA